MTDLTSLTIDELRDGYYYARLMPTDVTQAYLEAMEKARPLNAYALETAELAMSAARGSRERVVRDESGRSLEGIPLAVGDLLTVDGVLASAESAVTQRLWGEGAICLGKTSGDELGPRPVSATVVGPAVNPWRRRGSAARLAAGGACGGAAAAVAAHLCAGAVGVDGGGSILELAALAGIVAVRPTLGRCSRRGVAVLAPSLDQPGPLARSVRDAAFLLRHMAGYDPEDVFSAAIDTPDFEAAVGKSIKGTKIGVPKPCRRTAASAEMKRLWQQGIDWLRGAGAEIADVSLPHARHAPRAHYVVAATEASWQEDWSRVIEQPQGAGFGREVQRRLMMETHLQAGGRHQRDHEHAREVRALIRRDFNEAFESGVQAILSPATPAAAAGGRATGEQHSVAVAAGLAGLPAIAVPAGLDSEGLPLGLQLIGRPFGEEALFSVAQVIEDAAGRLAPLPWWTDPTSAG